MRNDFAHILSQHTREYASIKIKPKKVHSTIRQHRDKETRL